MSDEKHPDPSDNASVPRAPERSRLRRLLDERPEARSRLGRAFAILLGTVLVSMVAIGALAIWHLARRGRMIRDRLSTPRIAPLPEPPAREADCPS
jgi:hypothetical protein